MVAASSDEPYKLLPSPGPPHPPQAAGSRAGGRTGVGDLASIPTPTLRCHPGHRCRARARLALLGQAAPLGAAYPCCEGQGAVGDPPHGGRCQPCLLGGSEQPPAFPLPPPCQGPSHPTQNCVWDPAETRCVQKPRWLPVPPSGSPVPRLWWAGSCTQSQSAPRQLSLPPGLSCAEMPSGVKPL